MPLLLFTFHTKIVSVLKMVTLNFLFIAVIHYFAHCFNVDYFTSTHGIVSPEPNSPEDLIMILNSFEDKGNQTYLNPIRSQVVGNKTS